MKWIIRLLLIMFLILLIINSYVVLVTSRKIKDVDKIKDNDYDCIIVLGAGIKNKQPSPMLEDRLLTAIALYNNGVAKKILVSGDHEYTDYDEVNVMKNYLKENGIPSSDIFMDHAGISTYDSIYRARKIFKVNKAIIVTQKYHLHRALYIAQNTNMKAIGVSATKRRYFGQSKRNVREFAARIKDFFKCMFNKESAYLGEVIPINSDGDKTND